MNDRREIAGAFGTIDKELREGSTLRDRARTFFAILGPGLIVMAGDNDAGAFGTYAQAGQNYGTTLLWTLVILIPVLYVNQEMVLRLGAVTGVGHARLILNRFGRFWGAFSLIDLLVLNSLTIVTEFIGITFGFGYFGVPKIAGVIAAAIVVVASASIGNFRRFERCCIALCFGSVLLVPVLAAVHPSPVQALHDLFVPQLPRGSDVSTVVLLICAIVGTTIAPWQLFFQQSYVVDKKITPRYIGYERVDLAVGIAVVVVGAVAIVAICAATFAGRKEYGNFQDAGSVARGIAAYAGAIPGACFAIALIDASIVGAAAVALSTAYAVGDAFSLSHSLHRRPTESPAFYGVYACSIALGAIVVLVPGMPLGLLTNAVQVFAGILLPSATVFLLLLCNDEALLGPWVNGAFSNVFTGIVVAALVALSLVLTASTLFSVSVAQIEWTLVLGAVGALCIGGLASRMRSRPPPVRLTKEEKETWTMPQLETLERPMPSSFVTVWLTVLRAYLLCSVVLVSYRMLLVALHRG